MSKTETFIFGCGGHGKVVLDAAICCGYSVSGFIERDQELIGTECLGVKVVGESDIPKGSQLLLGIGSNTTRHKIYMQFKDRYYFPTLIHPNATVSRFAQIGEASVVLAGCVINPCAQIGIGCIINTSAVVEHDCTVGDFAHLLPNSAIAGCVNIGEFVHLGTNSSVIPLKSITSGCIIGAGAVVTSDINEKCMAAGVPAKCKVKLD